VSIGVSGAAPVLSVTPPVIAVNTPLNGGGSGSGMLRNTGDAAASVTSITADSSCTASGVSGFAMPGAPFTLGPGGMHFVGIGCSAAGYGIRRCKQNVNGPGPSVFTSYTGLCITAGTTQFMPFPASVNFGNVQVGSTSAPQSITVLNPMSNPQSTLISLQITDQDGNFTLGAPCLANGPGCDAPIILPPMGMFNISVTCSPQSTGQKTAALHVVGNAGTRVFPAILLDCNGTSMGGAAAISVNPTMVGLAKPLGTGSASSMVRVSNIGMGNLTISSISQSGSTDWSYSPIGGCLTFPCTLPMTGSFDIVTTFSPSAIGPRNSTLSINSDDPLNPMFQVQLNGTGQGATLALHTNLGSPPRLDLGTTPIGIATSAMFELRNDGNLVLDPVNLTLTQTDGAFGVAPNPTSIGAATLRTITVTCTPPAAMLYSADLDVSAPTAQSGSPLMIEVRCTGTAGSLFSTPSSLPLGEIRTGSPRVTRTIALKTAGPPLSIDSPPALVQPIPGVTVNAPSGSQIIVGAPVTFDVTIDAGMKDRDLTGAIEVTAGGDTLTIPVTGKVVTAALEYPTQVRIGSFCVGQATSASTARLKASGTATINLGAQPVLDKMSASPFQLMYTTPIAYPYSLPAGQTASVEVTPLRQMTKGTQTDVLAWTTDVFGDPSPRTTVIAEFVAEGGAIAPQLLDFETVNVREVGQPQVIKIQNCGMQPMALSGPFIEPSGDFRDDSPAPLPATLAPNQVATINVNFAPTKIGPRIATLTVESSAGTLSVMLLGQGIADPDSTVDAKSFYACDCRTSDPSAAWPVLVVVLVLRRRRR
jgi:MYXO-CTERM domain-containing protein